MAVPVGHLRSTEEGIDNCECNDVRVCEIGRKLMGLEWAGTARVVVLRREAYGRILS